MNQTTSTLQNVLSEKELCELFGMTKEQIGVLRNQKGLPYIKLSQTNRLYFEKDLIEFFQKQRTVLNRDVEE